MFDFAWSEIAVIAVVALVVIGPKDLPKVLRTVGTWVGKARAIAREFQSSLDQMIREAELEEVRKQVEDAAKVDMSEAIERTIDPAGDVKRSLAEPASELEPPPPPAPAALEAATSESEPTASPPTEETGETVQPAPAKTGTPA
ncbi:MAG TPA: Sec-independent protein translocase protein TatB [Stellaceae bacterium]|nr:Sec-independent protein translocase protein TatB [Stellaceae bacterium]